MVPLQGVPPAQPMVDNDAEQRAQIKDAQKIISYFNKINPPLVRADKHPNATPKQSTPVRLPIKDAIARFVPKDYKITTTPEVNTSMVITYDPSLPWMEALGKGLAALSLEMNANMYKKAMLVKPFETSLAEVIDKHVPSEYRVFTDAEVDVDTLVRFDESSHWIDALSKSGIEYGLDITANITRKLIVIKPQITNNKDQIKKP